MPKPFRAARAWTAAVLPPLALAIGACRPDERGGELHAQKVVLQREVEGLRGLAERLERGESILPPDDAVIVVEDSLVRDLLNANLPFETEVDQYRIRLLRADVTFRGSPLIALEGSVLPKEGMEIRGDVRVLGALEGMRVDPGSGLLSASVAVDHVDIERLSGFEAFLPGHGLDELARAVRVQLRDRIPGLSIPVRVAPRIDFPALDSGPVRMEGATLPLEISVSEVIAGRGRLWVAIAIKPGAVRKAGAGS